MSQVGIQFLLWVPRAGKFALFEFAKTATHNARTALLRAGRLAEFTIEAVGTRGWHLPMKIDEQVDGRWPSDHYPVTADIELR